MLKLGKIKKDFGVGKNYVCNCAYCTCKYPEYDPQASVKADVYVERNW